MTSTDTNGTPQPGPDQPHGPAASAASDGEFPEGPAMPVDAAPVPDRAIADLATPASEASQRAAVADADDAADAPEPDPSALGGTVDAAPAADQAPTVGAGTETSPETTGVAPAETTPAPAETAHTAPTETAPAPTVPPATGAPTTSTDTPDPRRPGRIRRFLRLLVKFLVVVAVLGAIAAAAVFGWPEFDERVLQRVDATASDTAQLERDLADAQDRIAEIDARTDALEADVADEIAALSSQIDDGLAAQDAEFTTQRLVSQSLDLLARARLYLYQANYGFAEADIATASAVLATVTDDPDGSVATAMERLDAAAAALPALPVVANDEVNLASAALLGDIPVVAQPTPAETAPQSAPPTTSAPAPTDGATTPDAGSQPTGP